MKVEIEFKTLFSSDVDKIIAYCPDIGIKGSGRTKEEAVRDLMKVAEEVLVEAISFQKGLT